MIRTVTIETNFAMQVGELKKFGSDMVDNQCRRIIDCRKKYRAVAVRPVREGAWHIDFEPVSK